MIGFSFAPDWSRERREFSGPITLRSEAKKEKQSLITFDTHLKVTHLKVTQFELYNVLCAGGELKLQKKIEGESPYI